MPLIAAILVLSCILIETIEQVLYRMGGRQRSRYFAFVLPATVLNVVGLGLWLLVLQRLRLGVALPLLAVSNLTVALAGRMLFGEVISSRRWIGVSLIVVGFVLVAMNQQ